MLMGMAPVWCQLTVATMFFKLAVVLGDGVHTTLHNARNFIGQVSLGLVYGYRSYYQAGLNGNGTDNISDELKAQQGSDGSDARMGGLNGSSAGHKNGL